MLSGAALSPRGAAATSQSLLLIAIAVFSYLSQANAHMLSWAQHAIVSLEHMISPVELWAQ